jgi:hypothetical protein
MGTTGAPWAPGGAPKVGIVRNHVRRGGAGACRHFVPVVNDFWVDQHWLFIGNSVRFETCKIHVKRLKFLTDALGLILDRFSILSIFTA